MTRFRILHAPPYELTHLSIPITDHYFTVDTAERATLEEWKKKNPHNLTYAFDGDELVGFVEILPLCMECGAMIEQQELREEDLTADMILPPETMQFAQYLYISGIAVKDLDTGRSKQCAAALVSCGAGMIRHLYGGPYLKKIFANPTTFWGNRIISKFGLTPVRGMGRSLKTGHDFYAAEVTSELRRQHENLEKQYQKFIQDYPWSLD